MSNPRRLDRLERIRWIEGHDEMIDEQIEGRPKRRPYRLTALGEEDATRAVADFYRHLVPAPAWLPRLEGT